MKAKAKESDIVTVRLDRSSKSRLERLSEATERSKSYLAAEAIREYLEVQEWQVAEIHKSLKEVEAGNFASEKKVRAAFDRLKKA